MTEHWIAPVDLIGWTLLHFVWQGTLVALALGFVLLMVPRHWARLRYVCACAALAAMVAAPMATALALRSGHLAPMAFVTGGGTHVAPLTLAIPLAGVLEGDPLVTRSTLPAPIHWLPWLVAAWALGVAFCAARLAGGWWQARRLAREGVVDAAPEWAAAVRRVAARLGMTRRVRLLESVRVQVPLVIGSIRPVLLLPAAALAGLTPQQLEAVIAHELAHIRRYDYLINLLQSAVETVLFYHPAVWWVSHTIRVEREHCCDDLAVKACGDPLLYARALTTLEALRGDRFGVAMAASSGSLLSRVRRLVGSRAPTPVASSGWVVAAATALMVAGAGASGWLPNPGTWLSQVTPPSGALAMAVVPEGSDGRASEPDAPQVAMQTAPASPAQERVPRAETPSEAPDTPRAPAAEPEALERTIEQIIEASLDGLGATLQMTFDDPAFGAAIAQTVEASLREAERALRAAEPQLAALTGDAVRLALREAARSLQELQDELPRELQEDLDELHRELQEELPRIRQELQKELPRIQEELRKELPRIQEELRKELPRMQKELRQELRRELPRLQRELRELKDERVRARGEAHERSAAARARGRDAARRSEELERRARELASDAARLGAQASRMQSAVRDAMPPDRLRAIQELARSLSEQARAFATEARQAQRARPASKPKPSVAPAPPAPPDPPAAPAPRAAPRPRIAPTPTVPAAPPAPRSERGLRPADAPPPPEAPPAPEAIPSAPAPPPPPEPGL